LHTLICR